MPKRSKNLLPVKDALADLRANMNADGTFKLTYEQFAERWHSSTQRVGYMMRKFRASKPAAKRGPKPVATAAVRRTSKHPVLARIGATLTSVENDLLNSEGYISAIPGLANAEINRLVKKSQAGIWSAFHQAMTDELAKVEKLSTGKPRRRKRRVVAPKAKAKG